MSSPSRTSQFNKLHKVLRKHYQAILPDPNRSVFEHLVFACCLENAHYHRAEEAMAALEHNFFDWNEIRVTTIRELSEVMASLPDPPAAANRVKRVLQSVFEATYSFDLEELRKKNLGPAVEQLKKIDGTTNFSVAYVTQAALGGHAIPLDPGSLEALRVVELVTEEEVQAGVISALERAISKTKGLEFASQLHQLGADFVDHPFDPDLHKILLEINPEARDRLPKRRPRKRAEPSAQAAGPAEAAQPAGDAVSKPRKKPASTQTAQQSEHPAKKAAASDSAPSESSPAAGSEEAVGEGVAAGKDVSPAKDAGADKADKQAAAGQDAASAGVQPSCAAKKAPFEPRKKGDAKRKPGAGKNKLPDAAAPGDSPSAGLSKRKPR